jgi:acetoin utilization deacetylase AcuC-like enzyme
MLNRPLPPGTGGEAMAKLYEEELVPAARRFRPGLILVSAGYDSHAADPLGGLALEDGDYARLTGILTDLADELSGGRLVVALEGGYDLRALSASVSATVRALMGEPLAP